jgi:uncharacterized membrane protein YphA (DoxX/SURF4 family)
MTDGAWPERFAAAELPMSQHNQFLAFIAQFCLVLLFPFSALDKIFNYQSAMDQAAHGWVPLPPSLAALLLVLGGMLEVVGPVCILLDFYRRQAALLFIFYVIATAVLFHNFWSFPFNGDAWKLLFPNRVQEEHLSGCPSCVRGRAFDRQSHERRTAPANVRRQDGCGPVPAKGSPAAPRSVMLGSMLERLS